MSTIKAINIQHPSSANTNIVMDANGNMTVAGTVIGNNATGNRNKIINGAFDIWQRGTSFTGNAVYTADRWWFVNDAVGASSVTQVDISTLGLGATYCLRAERTSGTNRWVVGTQLETTTLNQCRGKKITLSFKMRKGSALSSDVTVTLGSSSTEAKFGSVVDGGNITVTNASLNTSTFTTFSTTITIPAATAALGIKLEFSASQAGATGAYFDIADVQLEEGTVASPFERRPIALETALCEYYYRKIMAFPGGGAGYGAVSYYGGSSCIIYHGHFTMRTSPNTSYLNNAAMQYYSYAGVWTASTASTTINGTNPYQIASWFTADGDGRGKLLRKNDANPLILVLDSEL